MGQGARTNLRAATSGKLFSFWEKYQPAQAPATVHTPRPCSKVPHQIENKKGFIGEKRGLQLHNRSSKAWAKPTDSNAHLNELSGPQQAEEVVDEEVLGGRELVNEAAAGQK